MKLRDSTILIFGGSGLVGHAVARRLLRYAPRRLVLVALRELEVMQTRDELSREAGPTEIVGEWGDVFLPERLAQRPGEAVSGDPGLRAQVIADVFDDFHEGILGRSYFHALIARHRPDGVVDCINTATAFAYQNVYESVRGLLAAARTGQLTAEMIERHVLTLPVPQLIRHVQIAAEALQRHDVTAYVKIGTSGTGGMGFNVPYTHSEERPSRMLLTKSAMAGAHTLLLFLLGRTPGAPATVEIKPTATIGWREIRYGPIERAGQPMLRVDCPAPLPANAAFAAAAAGWIETGEPIRSVYVDVGENGYFARQEFETVTSLGSMELITAEEIAEYVVLELEGRPTGKDVVAALDGATAGPTYRAGIGRAVAVRRLEQLEERHGVRSIAFELLGPPRLTKMLYEAHICGRVASSVGALARADAATVARATAEQIAGDAELRSSIVSVGLPIVIEGNAVYRGPTVLIPPVDGDMDRAAARGWVDLRTTNCAVWIRRAGRMLEQAAARAAAPPRAGSGEEWDAITPDDAIRPSAFAAWVFRFEDGGERIKR